jgi:crotonobetainyl-CoA:carnitine CoA-transferase CaiB-like acyl-CoA transferase
MEGVRVLDLGTMLAAPFSAGLLADFGAEVIKVELPRTGDPIRQVGTPVRGHSLAWAIDGRNKKSITLDLRRPAGRELLLRLVAVSDVLLENFTPGTLEGWGLGEEALRATNPRLVLVRISGYGQEGPYSRRPVFDPIAQAFAGVTHLTGYPECPPVARTGVPYADYIGGLYGALSALLALYHRDARRGEGQTVDVALYEGVFRMTRELVAAYELAGRIPERRGNINPNVAPGDNFRTRDGHWVLVIASTQGTWERLARAMGQPELVEEPRLATNPQRVAHAAELHGLIGAWAASLDREALRETLEAHGVPAGVIYTAADIAADPQYEARGSLVPVPHPELGTVRMPSVGPRFSRTPGEIRHPGPDLGAHNEAIYGGLLGLSETERAALHEQGVI